MPFVCKCTVKFDNETDFSTHINSCPFVELANNIRSKKIKYPVNRIIYCNMLTSIYVYENLATFLTNNIFEKGIQSIIENIINSLFLVDGKYIYFCSDRIDGKFKMIIKTKTGPMVKDDTQASYLRHLIYIPINWILILLREKASAFGRNFTLSDIQDKFKNLETDGEWFVEGLKKYMPSSSNYSEIIGKFFYTGDGSFFGQEGIVKYEYKKNNQLDNNSDTIKNVELDYNKETYLTLEEAQKIIEQKNQEIEEMKKIRPLCKRSRPLFPRGNLIYIATPRSYLEEKTIKIGRTDDLKALFGTYNRITRTCFAYYRDCGSIDNVKSAERTIFNKLDKYRCQQNHEIFNLEDKDLSFFIGVINETIDFITNKNGEGHINLNIVDDLKNQDDFDPDSEEMTEEAVNKKFMEEMNDEIRELNYKVKSLMIDNKKLNTKSERYDQLVLENEKLILEIKALKSKT